MLTKIKKRKSTFSHVVVAERNIFSGSKKDLIRKVKLFLKILNFSFQPCKFVFLNAFDNVYYVEHVHNLHVLGIRLEWVLLAWYVIVRVGAHWSTEGNPLETFLQIILVSEGNGQCLREFFSLFCTGMEATTMEEGDSSSAGED